MEILCDQTDLANQDLDGMQNEATLHLQNIY